MPPLLQEKASPLRWTLQRCCQISYIFPCQGCSTPAPSTSRLLPVRARGPHLKIRLPIPDVGWLLQFSTFLKRDNAPSGQRTCPWCTSAAAAPNTIKRIDCCTGRNDFCLKSLNSSCSVSFKEKRKKTTLLLHQNHLLAFLTSTHVVTIMTGLLGSGIGGMLNRHTGTHQNICEFPKWNWHHGSGLYHTSEKGFITQIKQFNSWASCLGRATKCEAAYCYFIWFFIWLPASLLRIASSEVKHK